MKLDGKERFLLDESSLAFRDETPSVLDAAVQGLLDLLDYAAEQNEIVACWSEVWHVQSISGATLNMLLNEPGPIDRDLRMRLSQRLGRMPFWDETEVISVDEGVSGTTHDARFAPTAALAARRWKGNKLVALVVTNQVEGLGWRDVCILPTNDPAALFLLAGSDGALEFWRSVHSAGPGGFSDMEASAHRLYPRLTFANGVWDQTSKFEGPGEKVRADLDATLRALNDHAIQVWRSNSEPHKIQAAMSALSGVSISPESAATRKIKGAMDQRTIIVDGEKLSVEWHAKLEWNRNRVHFLVRERDVLIGIFAKHLRV